jgi:hypothetical protein
MKKMMRSAALLIGLVASVCTAQAGLERRSPDRLAPLAPVDRVARQVFEGRSPGWYWVYEGVAQAQTFVARGTRVSGLALRVARLNRNVPDAPLEVEVRDRSLRRIYLHGTIRAEDSALDFRWLAPEVDHAAPLEEGKVYVLLLHSGDTSCVAPWVVNAIYEDLYPDGRHLGHADDLSFSVSFAGGRRVRVGPPWNTPFDRPINSGGRGQTPVRRRLALYPLRSSPPADAADPLGAIPPGRKVWGDDGPSGGPPLRSSPR